MKKSKRGRPLSSEKRERDIAQKKRTSEIAKMCPGLYVDMWLRMHENGKKGFTKFSAEWCASQRFSDGTSVMDLTGNCVDKIIEGVSSCGKESWYSCTRKQFMFQIADVCIVFHCILSLMKEVNDGKLDKMTVKQHLASSHAFVLWASNVEDANYGDILSAGENSVLNFRQVLQDGVVFHCMQRMQPCRADKHKNDQLIDLHCFQKASEWATDYTVSAILCENGTSEIMGNCGLWYSLKQPELHKDQMKCHALRNLHLVTTTLGPFSRGKVLRHILGRMKTLVGHNNTIPKSLAWMLNPTLTKDNRKRKIGNGPVKWAVLEKENEQKMKNAKKVAKSRLCMQINTTATSTPMDLAWKMFSSPISVDVNDHGNCYSENVEHSIIEILQDKHYYRKMQQLYFIKKRVYETHRQQLHDLNLNLAYYASSEQQPTIGDMDSLNDAYKQMIVSASSFMTTSDRALFFDTQKTIEITNGVHMHMCNNCVWQQLAFRNMSLPIVDAMCLNDKEQCFMKDPDSWGFSWAPKCKRRRIQRQQVSVTQPIDILCGICDQNVKFPVFFHNKVACLRCVWCSTIGMTNSFLFTAGCVELRGPAWTKNIKTASSIWDAKDTVEVITNLRCGQREDRLSDEHQCSMEVWEDADNVEINRKRLTYTDTKGSKKERCMRWSGIGTGVLRVVSCLDDDIVYMTSEATLAKHKPDGMMQQFQVLKSRTLLNVGLPVSDIWEHLHEAMHSRVFHNFILTQLSCRENSVAFLYVLSCLLQCTDKNVEIERFKAYEENRDRQCTKTDEKDLMDFLSADNTGSKLFSDLI